MGTAAVAWWRRIRDSLWFVPGLITVAAVGLAAALVELDATIQAGRPADYYLAFGGGAEGARGVLSAIATSTVTVTGVVFSITIVALQLASSQYSPRVLRNFSNDRINQTVLGVFIATFTYSLLVLRTVRAGEGEQLFVPSISIGVAIALALLSVGCLIFYIHHVARSIRAAVIIDRAAQDTRVVIDRLFPEARGELDPAGHEVDLPEMQPVVITAPRSGYLQIVDGDALFHLAEQERLTLRVEPSTGAFVFAGEAIASLWSPIADGDQLASLSQRVRAAFVFGPEPTLEGDVEFGFRQIADIAIKVLSPAMNDPTTAVICINRLAELLVRLGNRRLSTEARRSEDGRLRLVTPKPQFQRAVDLSFDQICHYGSGDPVVAVHLLQTLGRIAGLVPPDRRGPLARQIWSVLYAAKEAITEPADRDRVQRAGDQAISRLGPIDARAPA